VSGELPQPPLGQGTPLGHRNVAFGEVLILALSGPAVGSDRDRNGGCGSYSSRFILEIILDNPIAIGWGGVGGASVTPVGTAGPFRAKNAFFWLWRGLRELLQQIHFGDHS
jgi:hypothetical protein